ncbi:MAG TPA: class I SAM-dependent methyltransferase [Candidatus Eisenbacteria bacterium]|jgi:SAM-dependent methyltransferase|nr:class I SAM-dependent methyltransferase [Candidatus Eisenbacteria bacterium]
MSSAAAPKPSPELIFGSLISYQHAFALKAAIELDLFTAIAEGATDAPSIAKRVNGAERGVRILADGMTVQGFLRKENGKYSLSQDSALFLDKRSPAYMGGMAEFLVSAENIANFSQFTDCVRKGGTVSSIGDNSKPVDHRWVIFAKAMGSMAGPMAGVLSQIVNSNPANEIKVLDIAAGHGMYGITVAKNNPRVHVTALDWPAVLEVAKENAQQAGVSDRYSLRPGSAFDADLGSGYDYVFITNFLHHFDVPTNEKLLRRFHAALKPGGKAITVEFVPNEDRVSPPMAAAFSMVMLINTDAGEAFTFAEYESMCRNAGYKDVTLQTIPDLPQRLVIAEK